MVPKATPPEKSNSRKRDASRSGTGPVAIEGFLLVVGLLRFLLKLSKKRPATTSSAKATPDEAASLEEPIPRKRYLMGLWSAFFVTWGLYLTLGLFYVVLARFYPFPDDRPLTNPPTPRPDSEMVPLGVWMLLILVVLPLFLLVGAYVSGIITAYFWNNDLSFEEEKRAEKKAVWLVWAPTLLLLLGACLLAIYTREWLAMLCILFLYVVFMALPVHFYCEIYHESLDDSRGFWLERKNKSAN